MLYSFKNGIGLNNNITQLFSYKKFQPHGSLVACYVPLHPALLVYCIVFVGLSVYWSVVPSLCQLVRWTFTFYSPGSSPKGDKVL